MDPYPRGGDRGTEALCRRVSSSGCRSNTHQLREGLHFLRGQATCWAGGAAPSRGCTRCPRTLCGSREGSRHAGTCSRCLASTWGWQQKRLMAGLKTPAETQRPASKRGPLLPPHPTVARCAGHRHRSTTGKHAAVDREAAFHAVLNHSESLFFPPETHAPFTL